jgi:hypothetical protein
VRCVCQLLSVMDFKCDDSACSVTELRVIDVLPESEAARKGVKVGDVVVAVDMKAAQVQPCLPAWPRPSFSAASDKIAFLNSHLCAGRRGKSLRS